MLFKQPKCQECGVKVIPGAFLCRKHFSAALYEPHTLTNKGIVAN